MSALGAGGHVGRRLLLVEDSESDVALITSYLHEVGGWEVITTPTLRQARMLLQRQSIDVVLLDLGLPDAQGSEGLADLRDQFEVPIVVLTGRPEASIGADALARGAQDFLFKGSIDADSLARSLRHAMQRHAHSRKLDRMQRRLQRYARAVAHDIRTPLTTMRGFAELIKVEERSSGRAGERVSDYADRIIHQSKILLNMVVDLLEESDGHYGIVDMTAAARWVEEVVGDQMDQQGAVMTLTRLPQISGERGLLRQIMLNLTTNSLVHASPALDGSGLEVRWSSERREDGGWDVVIEDNGGKVDESLLEGGQPWPVTDVRADADGHGLGMRMVAAGMAEHGGQVWLSRGATGGLRVTLTFPESHSIS